MRYLLMPLGALVALFCLACTQHSDPLKTPAVFTGLNLPEQFVLFSAERVDSPAESTVEWYLASLTDSRLTHLSADPRLDEVVPQGALAPDGGQLLTFTNRHELYLPYLLDTQTLELKALGLEHPIPNLALPSARWDRDRLFMQVGSTAREQGRSNTDTYRVDPRGPNAHRINADNETLDFMGSSADGLLSAFKIRTHPGNFERVEVLTREGSTAASWLAPGGAELQNFAWQGQALLFQVTHTDLGSTTTQLYRFEDSELGFHRLTRSDSDLRQYRSAQDAPWLATLTTGSGRSEAEREWQTLQIQSPGIPHLAPHPVHYRHGPARFLHPWSPGGDWLPVSAGTETLSLTGRTGEEQLLIAGSQGQLPFLCEWSPDGRTLALLSDHQSPGTLACFLVRPSDGHGPLQEMHLEFPVADWRSLVWSADSTHFFGSLLDQDGTPFLAAIDAHTRASWILGNHALHEPPPRPTQQGRGIVWVRQDPGSSGQWLMFWNGNRSNPPQRIGNSTPSGRILGFEVR